MGQVLVTERLRLRPWRLEDADAAFAIYGSPEVSRWLSPALEPVGDPGAMRLLLQQWIGEDSRVVDPAGRWAIELSEDGRVVGGVVLLYLPPGGEDLEIGWQLAPDVWGRGLASEAGHAVAHWALQQEGVDEVFAVARPSNPRRGHGEEHRDGVGGGDRQVLRPPTARLSASGRGRGQATPWPGARGSPWLRHDSG